MPRGGRRVGAGRKPGVGNLLTEELRKGICSKEIIHVLEEIAAGRVKDASVRDRVAAASALLDKILPNQRQIEIDATHRAETIFVGAGALEAAAQEGVTRQATRGPVRP